MRNSKLVTLVTEFIYSHGEREALELSEEPWIHTYDNTSISPHVKLQFHIIKKIKQTYFFNQKKNKINFIVVRIMQTFYLQHNNSCILLPFFYQNKTFHRPLNVFTYFPWYTKISETTRLRPTKEPVVVNKTLRYGVDFLIVSLPNTHSSFFFVTLYYKTARVYTRAIQQKQTQVIVYFLNYTSLLILHPILFYIPPFINTIVWLQTNDVF